MKTTDLIAVAALLGIGALIIRASKRPSIDGLPVWRSGNPPHESDKTAYCGVERAC